VFRLQVHVLAESTAELLLLEGERAQGGRRGREAAEDFSLGEFAVHKAPRRVPEHPRVRLPRFAFPSACSHLPGLTFTPGRLSPLHPAPQISVALGEMNASEAMGKHPAAQSTHPKRHPVKTSTCKPTLIVNRALHFISIEVNKP